MVSLDRFECGKLFPGVTFLDRKTVYVIGVTNIKIGEGTIIEPFVKFTGNIRIGKNCRVYFGFSAYNFECGDNCELGIPAQVMDVKLGNNCKIGRFAEIKKSVFGDDVNCVHFSYVGDAEVGNGVNIGAGTITCNYDGRDKHKTTIQDKAFIGSDTKLVAPLTVGKEAYIAAGSIVTEDVPPHALHISRVTRIIKEYVAEKMGNAWRIKK